MRNQQSNRPGIQGVVAYVATLVLLSLASISSWAAGPSAETTVAFLNSKYQQSGGGYTMESTTDNNFRYTRIFPISITMEQDGFLQIKHAEREFERPEGGDPQTLDRDLDSLQREGAAIKSYLIPLERMEFGSISNRRGDWPARKTLKKSTAKIRLLCKEKQNCIMIDDKMSEQHFDLFITDEKQREKIFKAFKHLIGLYQHRKELF